MVEIRERGKTFEELQRYQWWKGFWLGAVTSACVMFVVCLVLFLLMLHTARGFQSAAVSCQEENRQLQASLSKCREISEGNYDAATKAQEENRQNIAALRELIAAYQAEIQKGRAPAGLAEFLLKLLIK